MGWIIVLIIFVIILIAWLAGKREPTRTSPSSTTITQAPPRAGPRLKKTRELLKFGYERKLRLTIKYETGNPLPGEPAIKVRDVDIYGFGEEYFDAFCHYRNAQRTFKISRVLSVHLCDQTYQIPRDYVPSGWVTEGQGERRDATLEESVEVGPPDVLASSPPKDVEVRHKPEERQQASREAFKYGSSSETAKTYIRHD